MILICPNPIPWLQAYDRLALYASQHPCVPPEPPRPLILAGWVYSNDVEKMKRWEETLRWATTNHCSELVAAIPDSDFYCTEQPTSYEIGPLGGPMYLPWNYEAKDRPPSQELKAFMDKLLTSWRQTVGPELAQITRPLRFTGSKARRLLVAVSPASVAPWGEWSRLPNDESKRRIFTCFRQAINAVLRPHHVDHIDFTVSGKLGDADGERGERAAGVETRAQALREERAEQPAPDGRGPELVSAGGPRR